MRQFSAEAKHAILLEYSRYSRTNGFAALARRHSVPGGENIVAAWYSRWDRTSQSLKRASGSGRSRYLTTAEVNRNVRPRIAAANKNNRAINYSQMLPAIQQVTGKQVSLRTLRRYGKEIGASFKRARGKTNRERQRVICKKQQIIASEPIVSSLYVALLFLAMLTVTAEFCEEVAKARKQIQRVAKKKLLVLDETHCRINEVPTHSLVLPGESASVTVTDTGSYAARIDMFACIHESGTLPALTITPAQRKKEGVQGLNTELLIRYITKTLSPAVAALAQSSYVLVLDNARIHNSSKIIDAFARAGVTIEELIYMPTLAAKRLSPLDNALFHDWKDTVRSHCPLSLSNLPRIMVREWKALDKHLIQSHYKHCGFVRGCAPYFDCPKPRMHKHSE